MVRLIRGLRATEFTPVLGSVGEGWLAEAARPAGAEVVSLDRRSRYDGWDLTAVPRLAALIRRERADLVHSFLFHMDVLGTAAARIARVPAIASVRGVHYDFDTWYRRLAWMVTARLATAITAVSEEAADLLSRHARIPRTRIAVIPNGVDTDVLCPGPRAGVLRAVGVPDGAFVIGTVGRLDPIKGHVHLLGAAAEVVTKHPRCHFVFVGQGPAGDALAEQASALGLNGHVHFLGARNDILQLLREMDIFVLPSLSEGMSNALLEAMATGLPCVATSVGGNKELVRHRHSGFLVPPASARHLAAAIVRLAGDASMRARLGAAAREAVSNTFSLHAMIEAHHALYAKVVGGDKGAIGGRRDSAPQGSLDIAPLNGTDELQATRRHGRPQVVVPAEEVVAPEALDQQGGEHDHDP
jgi:glycosyltransferase involved in cell wall biosynthesis